MTLTNPLLINAIGNVEIQSGSGVINHNSETVFNHSNDQFIQDLKGLKGSLNDGDIIAYNGSNIYSIPSSNFALQSDLSTDESNISSLQSAVSALQNDSLAAADQVVKSVTSDSHLLLTGGALSLNLSDYLTSTQISDGYVSSISGTNFDTRISSLENDHVTVDALNGVSDRVSTLEGATSYISSVGSNLAVSGGNLTVDLSGLAPTDGASFVNLTTVQELSFAMGSGDAVVNKVCYYLAQTAISQSGTLGTYACGFGRTQHFRVKAYVSGAVNGQIDFFKQFRGTPMSEISECSSTALYGTVSGSEITVINIPGENIGCFQSMNYALPAYASMVVELTFVEQPAN